MAGEPYPLKPPSRRQALRFVMAADAGAGEFVEVDLNTGWLVPTGMTADPVAGDIPDSLPPGLLLRALAAEWRARPGGNWADAARQLDAVLDMIGAG